MNQQLCGKDCVLECDAAGAITRLAQGQTVYASGMSAPPMLVAVSSAASMWEARSWEWMQPDRVQVQAQGRCWRIRCDGFGGRKITATLTVTAADDEFRFDVVVRNDDAGVVVAVTSANLAGFNDQSNGCLYVPDRIGRKLAMPFAALQEAVTLGYPVPLSLQLAAFNTGTQGWAVRCEDAAMAYKALRIGGPQHELAVIQYPLLECGRVASLAPVFLHVHEGSWHVAADRYRRWFESVAPVPAVSAKVKSLPVGDHVVILSRPQEDPNMPDVTKAQEVGTYDGAIARIASSREKGNDAIHVVGWHDRGHDTDFPEFRVSEAMGGAAGLRRLAAAGREQGMQVGYYMNGRLVNVRTPFYAKHPEALARTAEGVHSRESYGGETFEVLCPHAEVYIRQLEDRVTELARDFSADFIQLDQVGAAPGLLCFDASHGHSTPATAWGEGYHLLLSRVLAAARRYNPDFWIWIEGAWEGCGAEIDVSMGGPWSFHKEAVACPAIYRFSMPQHPVFGDAILGGVPIWQGGIGNPAVAVLKQHVGFFSNSRYMDTLGLTFDDTTVAATWHLSGDKAAVVIKNKTLSPLNTQLQLRPSSVVPFCPDRCVLPLATEAMTVSVAPGCVDLCAKLSAGSVEVVFLRLCGINQEK